MTAAGGWELVTEVDGDNPVLGDLRKSGTALAKIATLDAAVVQACSVVMRWWLGEWFLDRRRGMPYLQQVLRKGVSEPTIRALYKSQLERVEGVVRVKSIEVSIDRTTRECVIDEVIIETTDGETTSLPAVEVGF
jgi:hypothetical protein